MKRFLILILLLISTIQVFSQTLKEVRFDGLYQSETEGDYRSFLRLYSDGTVLSITSTGQVSDLKKWFKKPYKKPYHSRGLYEIKGNRIYFTTTSSSGTVVYEGIIESEYKLIITTKSLINGHEDEKIYYFITLLSGLEDLDSHEMLMNTGF